MPPLTAFSATRASTTTRAHEAACLHRLRCRYTGAPCSWPILACVFAEELIAYLRSRPGSRAAARPTLAFFDPLPLAPRIQFGLRGVVRRSCRSPCPTAARFSRLVVLYKHALRSQPIMENARGP